MNVRFGERLIYIGSTQSTLSAFGMNVSNADWEKLLALVSVDELVINKGTKLIFYSVGGIIELDYLGAQQVNLKIPQVQCRVEQIANTRLYKHLLTLELATKTGLPQDEQTKKYLDLLKNTDKNDQENNFKIIKFFAGRGLGLTPSGDDLLLGFSMALVAFDKSGIWMQNLRTVTDENVTTIISVAYMNALLNGYLNYSYLKLIQALDIDNISKIEHVVQNVATVGHTSGNDTLCGLLLGLEFLSKT